MIRLNTPGFWYAPLSLKAMVLMPLSWVWMAASALRMRFTKPYVSSLPVICVGNVSVGGAGKTPTAIALRYALPAGKPCFLTRGFGGLSRNAALVTKADSREHGDEAVLLAAHAPVIIASSRAAGLRLAEKSGFDLVIADDGFQNPSFKKTASVLVFDGSVGIGNGLCVPAGPLRETLSSAVARASAAIIIGDDRTHLRDEIFSIPVYSARMETNDKPLAPYVAFAGIGRPQKFFDTLKDAGFVLAESISFPDHHVFTESDLARLKNAAKRHNAHLITTEKDHVRLPADMAAHVRALPVQLRIDDLDDLVDRIMPS